MNKEVLKAIHSHKIAKDFWSYYHEANSNSALSEKEELLVRLTASLSSGCIPWMQKYLGVAEENDVLTPDEIITVMGVTMTVSAGKNFMHLMQALNTMEDATGTDDDQDDECYPGCCDEEQDEWEQ